MERRSLEQLDGDRWGQPPPDSSYLVRTVHALRSKPLDSLDVEDLRILIGQEVGLDHLMPLALRVLEADPLAEGDFYPGDLLVAVLRVGHEYWERHPDEDESIKVVVAGLKPVTDAVRGFLDRR